MVSGLDYRRLEKGTFHWPSSEKNMAPPVDISPCQLRWLLDGLPINQKQAHPEVKARTIL
ncbi:IS66 family insertion sequence element accessory protein TnpB [Virgibacillus pantothenticus]|uniref:IS66 family insertion sequence element accessory protein TnpB n=1 Tax=Virgibacillus pantothenticus TaxID=1473 RepID=UPI000984118B|nr:IS66 family insertion sequence element accessory protein TnpB [Virgibacillus pantothenticus]